MTEFLIFAILIAITTVMFFFFGWPYFIVSLLFATVFFVWGWIDGKDED